jgi:hypothetical protein
MSRCTNNHYFKSAGLNCHHYNIVFVHSWNTKWKTKMRFQNKSESHANRNIECLNHRTSLQETWPLQKWNAKMPVPGEPTAAKSNWGFPKKCEHFVVIVMQHGNCCSQPFSNRARNWTEPILPMYEWRTKLLTTRSGPKWGAPYRLWRVVFPCCV